MIKFLTIAFLLGFPVFASAQAEICFETKVIDMGTIEYGSKGIFTFNFTNCGDAILIISSGRTSCGCVVCTWPRDPILPKKSQVITVRYDTKRQGPTTKTATITSNASKDPVIVLTIKCKVLPPPKVEIRDSTIDFGAVKSSQKMYFEFKNLYADTLKILKIEQVSGKQSALVPTQSVLNPSYYHFQEEGKKADYERLEFFVNPDEKGKKFNKKWKVYFDDNREPVLLTATGKVI